MQIKQLLRQTEKNNIGTNRVGYFSRGVKRVLLIGLLIFFPQFAFAGSQTFTSSETFTVPAYGTLTVEVWGGGASGGGSNGYVTSIAGNSGTQSSFSGVVADGGIGPAAGTGSGGLTGGQGGTASGGDVPPSQAGSDGGAGWADFCPYAPSGAGGSSPNGGAGGAGISTAVPSNPGSAPGGGGGGGLGAQYQPGQGLWYCRGAAGGGAGAYSKKTYAAGALTPGSSVTVTVGSGGAAPSAAGPGGVGAAGRVTITWTDPLLQCDGTSQTYSSGTYTVPTYSTMTVEVWGGGGGGGGYTAGANGSNSSFASATGNGGTGAPAYWSSSGGFGGGASGGDSGFNQSGSDGLSGGSAHAGGTGGASPQGGLGGAGGAASGSRATAGSDGAVPGGGGGGATSRSCSIGCGFFGMGGGGGGGYAKKVYTAGSLSGSVSLTVGVGGSGGASYYAFNGYTTTDIGAGGAGASGSVAITCSQNSPPTTPTITGPTTGLTKTNYTYTFQSTDPDSDTLRYGIDWDDDDTIDEWAPALGYVSSGTATSTTHSWNSSNTQTFQVLAEDSQGNRSDWAPYTVNMSPNAPTVLLTATPDEIGSGESSLLEWSSENANSCTGTNFSTSDETDGTATVSPTETTTYTVTCFGAGDQEASDSAEVIYTCTPTNICGTGANANRRYNSCTGAEILPACPYQCAAGACISPPPPTFNPDAETDTTGHLQVRPSLLVTGDFTYVFWNVSNVQSCTVEGDNTPADSWTVLGTALNNWTSTSGSTGRESAPIEQRTTYTLSCTPLEGQSFTPETETVDVLPEFHEL